MKKFADAYIEVMQQRWQTAKQKEQTLLASFQNQHQEAQDLGVKAAEYSMLQSELGRAERICEILDNRIKELNVTEDTGALNISILEVARPADSPSRPDKTRVMAIALVLGLMFGGGLALLRDWLDTRLQSTDEISTVLDVPVLGVIPTIPNGQTIVSTSRKVWLDFKPAIAEIYQKIRTAISFGATDGDKIADVTAQAIDNSKTIPERPTLIERAQKVRREFRSMSRKSHRAIRAAAFSNAVNMQPKPAVVISSSLNNGSAASENRSVVDYGQKVYIEPRSFIAEAYRTVRTSVFFGVPKDEAKTILITSPAPGDRKSTIVSNLAIAMAQAGQKTLVLDADFRKPMQHNIFEMKNEEGLGGIIAGTIALDEAIRPGPVDGLDVLVRGPAEMPNPSEILSSNLFAKLLNDLSESYDRVIVDSPPIGLVADSQILAAICDITLLALVVDKSTRKQSRLARDSLLSVGGRLLGVVASDVPRRRGRYGYYSGYGYYKGYGYGEEKKAVEVQGTV